MHEAQTLPADKCATITTLKLKNKKPTGMSSYFQHFNSRTGLVLFVCIDKNDSN